MAMRMRHPTVHDDECDDTAAVSFTTNITGKLGGHVDKGVMIFMTMAILQMMS